MDTNNNKALEQIKTQLASSTVSQPSVEDTQSAMAAELAKLRAENEALKAKQASGKTDGGIKISPKKAVAVYGFGRWPVTLYLSQWEQLFSRIDDIKAFIEKHRSELATKPGDAETQDQVKVS